MPRSLNDFVDLVIPELQRRGLFRKGATFANAILFEFASTNLVFELGLVILVLLGWQFLAAEFAGGLLMIAILAVIFKYTLRARMVEVAKAQAEKGLRGRMGGYAVDASYGELATRLNKEWDREVERLYHLGHQPTPAQSEVIGAVNDAAGPRDVVVCAGGSMPGK